MNLSAQLLRYSIRLALLVSIAAPGFSLALELGESDNGCTVTLTSADTKSQSNNYVFGIVEGPSTYYSSTPTLLSPCRLVFILYDTLTIVLPGNPTTGFLWENTQLDADMLKQEGEAVFTGDSEMIGAGGKFTFRFLPLKAGSARLKLIYRRPWEKGVAPLKTFEAVVKILPQVADDCLGARNSKAPQPEFMKPEGAALLVVKKRAPADAGKGEGTKAPLGNYRFHKLPEKETIVVTGKSYCLELSVPDFDFRPLDASWINPKLLYLEVWFNPHNGAYWIYDLDGEAVLLHEFMNDGQKR